MTKKLFIKTHGCQMNEYDSAKMFDLLEEKEKEKKHKKRYFIKLEDGEK